MTNTILRYKLLFNNIRQFHRSGVVCNINKLASAKENNEFKGVYNQVLNSLTTSPKIAAVPEVAKYVKKIFDYTLSGGRHNRGLCIPVAYQLLEHPKNITKENLHSARVFGWCLEMLHGWFLVGDDVLDGSTTRRGKPCWYLLPDVNSYPIVDCMLMGQAIMQVLEVNFGDKSFYHDAIRYFNEATLYTTMGEYLECCATYSKENDTSHLYTMEHYCTTSKYTNSYYAFKLPICLAQLLVQNSNKSVPTEWMDLFCDLAILFQMKNDYSDVYGDVADTGKVSTDITEGKRTWLAVAALELCNETQRSTFKEYYGSKDPQHAELIKTLYDDLQLPSVFKKQEKQRYSGLLRRINALPTERERNCFTKLLEFCMIDQL